MIPACNTPGMLASTAHVPSAQQPWAHLHLVGDKIHSKTFALSVPLFPFFPFWDRIIAFLPSLLAHAGWESTVPDKDLHP